MDFGDRIEELRMARGWTHREVADKLEVSERTYQLWRSGRTYPYQKHLKRLAEIYEPLSTLTDESAETTGRMERMEEKLDRLLGHLGIAP
jgi:transcriptional regulator with XRE-family HTH domain